MREVERRLGLVSAISSMACVTYSLFHFTQKMPEGTPARRWMLASLCIEGVAFLISAFLLLESLVGRARAETAPARLSTPSLVIVWGVRIFCVAVAILSFARAYRSLHAPGALSLHLGVALMGMAMFFMARPAFGFAKGGADQS